ncbi:MAG: hypothetical protein ABJC39_07690 [Chloroflexota bacterium]
MSPSATPTAVPSPTAALIAWSPASLKEDWPAPVRLEAVGGAIVRKLADYQGDPRGDTGSSVPWIDILEVHAGNNLSLKLAVDYPPFADPTEQWIAYGLVVDDDRDGVPDRRIGIDNLPVTAKGSHDHRAWVTDLHTGRTVSAVGPPYGRGVPFDSYFYAGYYNGPAFDFGRDTTRGFRPGIRTHFYAWASMIQDGRVVATDYAPDAGWLDPGPEGMP